MARKSRIASAQTAAAEHPPRYNVALYIRLSVLNGGNQHTDRDSVENQEELLRQFIADKPQLVLTSVYIDNGETGVNFNRSDFGRLIGDVQAGKITCIIVKDLSRFGRNYIETGEYLEKIFPFLGVRFIAVNDSYDSLDPCASDSLSMHLKSLANDIYSRDLSRKIGPVLRAKQERGEFIGGWAPYGYLKSKEDKHKLVIDEETAPIVRQIYQWRLEGVPYMRIAKMLQQQGIPSPAKYLYRKKILKDQRFSGSVWCDASVRGIASDQVYLGHIAQGKTRAALCKGETKKILPPEEWIVVAGKHEPIIGEELFEKVQNINLKTKMAYVSMVESKNKRVSGLQPTENLLVGLVTCGVCGKRMKRSKGTKTSKGRESSLYYRYVCRTHSINQDCCPVTAIKEDKLLSAVYELVRIQINLAIDIKNKKRKSSNGRLMVQRQLLKTKIKGICTEIERIHRHREALYDDYADRLMSEREYLYAKKRYEEKAASLQKQRGELEEQEHNLIEEEAGQELWIGTYLRFQDDHCLTKEMAAQLIEKIAVYGADNFHVQLRFVDECYRMEGSGKAKEAETYEEA